jgi:tripartite ATP-independent transporter DctP family solute receptor
MLYDKGRRVVVAVTALACLALAATSTKVRAQAADKLEMKLGHVATLDNPYHLGAQRFAELVSERTGGRVTVKIFPNAQLGNERDLIEGLQLGTIQMTIAANAPLSRYTARVLLFDLPFLFRDDAHWDKVVDGDVGKQIADEFGQYGFRTLGYFDGGWRSPYNSKKPISSIDDIKGMKFRTMESPMHIAIYQAMGARGVPMASSEQYSALEQGVVDGSDAPISFYSQLRHHEIAKHLSSLPLFKLTVHLLISEKAFQSVSPETREVLVKAGREAAAFERSKAREIDAKLLEGLQAKGVKISPLAPADRDKFIDAMRNTVWVEYGEKVGKDRIQRIIETR